MKISMCRLSFILFVLCLSVTTQAQRIFQAGQDKKLEAQHAFVFIDTTNQLTLEQISAPSIANQFTQHNREDLNFGYENNNIWLRFQVENTTSFDDFILVQYLSSVDYVTLYARDTANIWQETLIGDRIAFTEREVKNRFFVFPLDLRRNVTYRQFDMKLRSNDIS